MTEESKDEENDMICTHKLSWTPNSMWQLETQTIIQYMHHGQEIKACF